MTPVKLPIDPFLKPNLTTKLLGVGLVLTIIFILIALFSPLLQAIGLIQDPTDILSPTSPQFRPLVRDECARL